ncbi:olfactory receptor 14A16-like [Strix uralensis]|uniref:olfactory receptor 14A16-like n=1 Tax=Strix uralensis TaxID=36305 RepID=UPI003DA72775
MSNSSSITEFLLLAFADTRELQLLHFWLFLGIYLAALLGNGLIITAIACDRHLHTPMYFFLLNLSLLDLGSISTTLPKAMANSLWDARHISYLGCATQFFFFLFLMVGEYFLLTIMAYNRYVAICKPLHYGTLLGSRACVHMAAAAWGTGFLWAVLHTANTFSLLLCQGNAVDQSFCEVPQILELSCSESDYLREVGLIIVSISFDLGCFVFIVVSYGQIFQVVLRIPSEQGRHKVFSTCLPHLAVVSLFISTVMFAYLKPPSISSPTLDLVVSFLYSVVSPTLNPLIYSLRNREITSALRKLIGCVSAARDCQTVSANDYQSAVVQDWARGEGIEWVFYTPYYPQANGMVERYVGQPVMVKLLLVGIVTSEEWMMLTSCLAVGIHMDNQDPDDNGVVKESCEIDSPQKNMIGLGVVILGIDSNVNLWPPDEKHLTSFRFVIKEHHENIPGFNALKGWTWHLPDGNLWSFGSNSKLSPNKNQQTVTSMYSVQLQYFLNEESLTFHSIQFRLQPDLEFLK